MPDHKSPSFFTHFANLQDPRIERTKRHKLLDIVLLTIFAVTSGANDVVGIEEYGKRKEKWLGKYLELPNGIPSHDTIGRVLAAIDPDQFTKCFLSWVQTVAEASNGRLVNIDGKTARATTDRAKNKNPLHVVSAWASENHLLLGQVATDEKSNEITAVPKLLEILDVAGAIVTIDAMGCQKKIAEDIRTRKGDYVLTVKGNQEHLQEDVEDYFAKLDERDRKPKDFNVHDSEERAHGRHDYRRYEAVKVPKTLRHRDEWKDVRSLCRVTRVYTEKGIEKSDVRYFISSLQPDAKLLARAIRGHWGVENGLHWVLDMYFGEDRCRLREGYAAENLAQLRRWVLSLLRRDRTTNGGAGNKRLQAGWNNEVLEKIFGLC